MTTPTNDAEARRQAQREQRQAERERIRDERVERDAATLAATTPVPLTATDALGVERIIGSSTDYTPPQVDPDPKEVERLANVQRRLDNQKQARLEQLTTPPSGDGGGTVARDALAAQAESDTAAADLAASTTTPSDPQAAQDSEREAREQAAQARREARNGPVGTGDPSAAPTAPTEGAPETGSTPVPTPAETPAEGTTPAETPAEGSDAGEAS